MKSVGEVLYALNMETYSDVERVLELEAATEKSGDELLKHLLMATRTQFERVPEDPEQYTLGKMTFSALLQAIYNDMLVVDAPQDVIDALCEVRSACNDVVTACEKHGGLSEQASQETQEAKP